MGFVFDAYRLLKRVCVEIHRPVQLNRGYYLEKISQAAVTTHHNKVRNLVAQ